MGAYTLTKGGSIEIDLSDDFRDNGWRISGAKAIHSSCNNGEIKMRTQKYKVGVPNLFRYTVSGLTSGSVQLRVGNSSGASVTVNGEHTDVITPQLGDIVRFYSDGNLTVEILDVSTNTEASTGNTLYFSEDGNKWIMYSSLRPEFMLKFGSSFFAFKNGGLWENHVNETRNNFFGVQYSSQITFYCNLSPDEVKNFHSIREKSNKVWSVIDAEIEPYYGKPNGQSSYLKKGRFKNYNGDWFSDFLRDLNDNRFVTTLDALFKGAQLQGSVMKITIENKDTVEVKLQSVDIIVSTQQHTY